MKKRQKKRMIPGKSLTGKLVVTHSVVAVLAIIMMGAMTFRYTNSVMTQRVAKLTTAINDQYSLNINNYIDNVEDTCALAFAKEDVYQYNPEDVKLKEYDKIQRQQMIQEYLLSISLAENFSDFAIVYSDNSTVGRVSAKTAELFPTESIYQELQSKITNQSTSDGWFTGVNDNYNRIYYVKQLNEKAILMTSIFTTELESVLEYSNELSNMTIRIVEEKNHIIYSTKDGESGQIVPKEIKTGFQKKSHNTYVNRTSVITGNQCVDHWKIISEVPKSSILGELDHLKQYSILLGGLAVLLCSFFGIVIARQIVKPVKELVRQMKQAQDGDLTVSVEVQLQDEIGKLGESFNGMMKNISSLVHQVNEVADLVGEEAQTVAEIARKTQDSSESISTAMEDIAEGNVTQLDETQNTYQKLNQLAENINGTMQSIEKVTLTSEDTRSIGQASIQQMKELQEKSFISNQAIASIETTFQQLSEEIGQVEHVLAFILEISEETNLLSLNASIEAARAGEAGAGFSVVASEVKKLAEQTQQSTENIKTVIQRIYQCMDETVNEIHTSKEVFSEQAGLVDQTNESFQKIIQISEQVTSQLKEMEHQTKEMNQLKDHSLASTNAILSTTENASANSEEVMSATLEELENTKRLLDQSEELKKQVEGLRNSLSLFKVQTRVEGGER